MKQPYTQLAEWLNQYLQNEPMSTARAKRIRSFFDQEIPQFFVPQAAYKKALAERNRYQKELRKVRTLETKNGARYMPPLFPISEREKIKGDLKMLYQSRPGRTYKSRRKS